MEAQHWSVLGIVRRMRSAGGTAPLAAGSCRPSATQICLPRLPSTPVLGFHMSRLPALCIFAGKREVPILILPPISNKTD